MSDSVTQSPVGFVQAASREAVLAAPPVAAWALNPNTVVAILTSIYVCAQLAYLIWRWRRERKIAPRWRDDDA